MKNFMCFISSFIVPGMSLALNVTEPQIETFNSIEIHSKDDQVQTLGKVDFIIDPFASRDDLIELNAREQKLVSPNGKAFTTFGYNKDAKVLIASHKPIAHASVIGKEKNNVLVLFYDKDNRVIAPQKESFRIYDLESFKPIDFDYTPTLPPKDITLNVDLLIDVSGSMSGGLGGVTDASKTFMEELPDFTRCSVLTFGSHITHLTNESAKKKSCRETVNVLDNGLSANGATALHLAIKQSMEEKKQHENTLPNMHIVLTDGADTQNPEITPEQLVNLKQESNSKVLFFWAGHYNDHLKSLADIETVSTSNIHYDLDAFFRSIGVSINGMQSLTIK